MIAVIAVGGASADRAARLAIALHEAICMTPRDRIGEVAGGPTA